MKGKDEREVGYVKRNAIAGRRSRTGRRSRRIWTGGRAGLPISVCMARPARLLRSALPKRLGRFALWGTGAVWAAAGSRAQGPGGLRDRPGHEQLPGFLAADRGERPSRGVGRPRYRASRGRGGGGSCLVRGTSPTDCRARASCRPARRCCAGTIGGDRCTFRSVAATGRI